MSIPSVGIYIFLPGVVTVGQEIMVDIQCMFKADGCVRRFSLHTMQTACQLYCYIVAVSVLGCMMWTTCTLLMCSPCTDAFIEKWC